MPEKKEPTTTTRKKKRRNIILIIVAALIVIRLCLPFIVLHFVNKKLSSLDSYYGRVDDIDIALYRGAYIIYGFDLYKKVEKPEPDTVGFMRIREIDLSVEWGALFNGRIVGEIIVHDGRVNFVREVIRQSDIEKDTADFRELVKALMPLDINRVKITNSEIHYMDLNSQPTVDLYMNSFELLALNLGNVKYEDELLPSSVVASGNLYGGRFNMEIQLDALAEKPTFDLNAELSTMDIRNFNNFFKAYGNFDAERGTMSLYTEMAARDMKIGGYVKPLIVDLDIVNWKEEKDKPIQLLWETVVGAGAEIFENQPKDQLATKVEIEGRIDDPNVNLLNLIGYTLRNAFLTALRPAIEKSININRMENTDSTILERIFGKKQK